MKKKLIILIYLSFLISCQNNDQDINPIVKKTSKNLLIKARKGEKVQVCHWDNGNKTWHSIEISKSALPAHVKHGDIFDSDGDGYFPVNECGIGSDLGWDCNDNDPNINPGNETSENGYFVSEFFDLNDNLVPEGWDFTRIRNGSIKDGKILTVPLDAVGALSRSAQVSCSTKEIILEMDAFIAYSFWGLKPYFKIYDGSNELAFLTGEENYGHPRGYIANEVRFYDGSNYFYPYESLSPTIQGVYHLKLIMNDEGYLFIGTDPNGDESFRINYSEAKYSKYFNFRSIEMISFVSYVTTSQFSSWIDNLKITVIK